jgi:PhnB protein
MPLAGIKNCLTLVVHIFKTSLVMAKKAKKKAAKKTAKKAVKRSAKKVAKKKPAKKTAKPAKKAVKKAVKRSSAQSGNKAVIKPQPKENSINPYLTFNGNCESAFNFYRSVFGGEFPYIGRFKDIPPMEGQPPMSEEAGNMIMHVSLPIGHGTILMGSDSSSEWGHATNVGNNFNLSVNAKSRDEADRLYSGLSEGGKQTMPMNQTFWGSYFGMLTDKFEIQWMISHEESKSDKM